MTLPQIEDVSISGWTRPVRPKLDGSLWERAGEMRAKLLTLPRRPGWWKRCLRDGDALKSEDIARPGDALRSEHIEMPQGLGISTGAKLPKSVDST